MFQIKDGKISLNKVKTLRPKQLMQLSRLADDKSKNNYLLSLLGLVKGKQAINRVKVSNWQADALAVKPKSSILKAMQKLQRTEIDHMPSNKGLGDWIGVEIECYIPHQDGDNSDECSCEYDENGETEYMCSACDGEGRHWGESDAHNWLARQLKDAKVSRCYIKGDGSLDDSDGHGVEVTILFNSAYGFEPLERLCAALTKARCYVNKTCGLHVHLDVRHLVNKRAKIKRIGQSIGHALPVLKWLVPESRHNNQYCALSVSGFRGGRYHAVNLTSYSRHKTIEIRLHSGTISASKITNWIKILKVCGGAKLKASITSFQELLDLDGMTDALVDYCDRRVTELNPNAWSKLMPMESSAWPRAAGPVAPLAPVLTQLQGQGEVLTVEQTIDLAIRECRIPPSYRNRAIYGMGILGTNNVERTIDYLCERYYMPRSAAS